MSLGDFFKEDNKGLCRWLGIFFLIIFVSAFVGGVSFDYTGIAGWFRQCLMIGIILMGLLGIALTVFGFTKDKPNE